VVEGVQVDQVPVVGYHVRVTRTGGRSTVEGELLAAGWMQLWVLSNQTTVVVERDEISRVEINLYEASGEVWGAIGWTFLGVISTASNGWLAIFTAPAWLIAGTATAITAANASDMRVDRDGGFDELYQFARFPQGLPAGWKR
jgi:hypothetical protein